MNYGFIVQSPLSVHPAVAPELSSARMKMFFVPVKPVFGLIFQLTVSLLSVPDTVVDPHMRVPWVLVSVFVSPGVQLPALAVLLSFLK